MYHHCDLVYYTSLLVLHEATVYTHAMTHESCIIPHSSIAGNLFVLLPGMISYMESGPIELHYLMSIKPGTK